MTSDDFDQLRVWDRFAWNGDEYTVRDFTFKGGVRANVRKGATKRLFTIEDREAMTRLHDDPELWHGEKKPNLRDLSNAPTCATPLRPRR